MRAVRALEARSSKAEVSIRLTKNIPIGRGLGGGSADAAVTFLGLERFFKRALHSQKYRMNCAETLGSDVPFFAMGGRAAGSGTR